MVQSHFYDPKAFIEYLLDMQGICKNIGEYDPKKSWLCSILIAQMISNKKPNPIAR